MKAYHSRASLINSLKQPSWLAMQRSSTAGSSDPSSQLRTITVPGYTRWRLIGTGHNNTDSPMETSFYVMFEVVASRSDMQELVDANAPENTQCSVVPGRVRITESGIGDRHSWTESALTRSISEEARTKSSSVLFVKSTTQPGGDYYLYAKVLQFGSHCFDTIYYKIEGHELGQRSTVNRDVTMEIKTKVIRTEAPAVQTEGKGRYLQSITIETYSMPIKSDRFIRYDPPENDPKGILNDVNYGLCSGQFVYFATSWTSDAEKACSHVNLFITEKCGRQSPPWAKVLGRQEAVNFAGLQDFADGTSTYYQFVGSQNDMFVDYKIVDVVLVEGRASVPHGWDDMTGNINERRGGRDVRIAWKTEDVRERKC